MLYLGFAAMCMRAHPVLLAIARCCLFGRQTTCRETASPSDLGPGCLAPPPLILVSPALFVWQAYAAWLGFYNSTKGMGWSKPELVQQANRFAGVMGLSQPPALMKKTIGMMVSGALWHGIWECCGWQCRGCKSGSCGAVVVDELL